MKFTTLCFVRVKDAEKRNNLLKWMFDIGYAGRYRIDRNYSIVVAGLTEGLVDVAADNTTKGLETYGLINCGENVKLFKALAAMNDGNDHYQWFVATLKPELLALNNSMDNNRLFAEPLFRKATAEEIIEHFKTTCL